MYVLGFPDFKTSANLCCWDKRWLLMRRIRGQNDWQDLLAALVFSNESTLRMRWPKYWSFSFSISPSSEHPGLISFRMDWLDLFAVQGTLKSLLQHHSSKASVLWHSAFFTVHLSHPCMTTGKTVALTRWTIFGKVMSLLFNMLSRLVTEKAMALHSGTLAWKIRWTEEPGRLKSIGPHRVRHDWSDLAAAA